MNTENNPQAVTLLTLSFAGDFQCCRLLCETADLFAPTDATHLLAVPAADMVLFRPLASRRRTLVAQEELLPSWLHKLPLPGPEWRRRLRLPRRNVYMSLRCRPVRGWIAQQIMKLNAAAAAPTEMVLHLDSDCAFIRPLPVEALSREGSLRLARFPGRDDDAMHVPWHHAASMLLGLPNSGYHGSDYIDQFVTWRRANVRGLMERIGSVTGRDPAEALAQTRNFSEYIIYGVYCEHLLGLDRAGHHATAESLCETVWQEDEHGALPSLAASRYGLGIQSTVALSPEGRRRIIAEATRRAEAGFATLPA